MASVEQPGTSFFESSSVPSAQPYYKPELAEMSPLPMQSVAGPMTVPIRQEEGREGEFEPSMFLGADFLKSLDGFSTPSTADDVVPSRPTLCRGASAPPGLMDCPPGLDLPEKPFLPLPSVGSVGHGTGSCRPCAHFHKSGGCSNGYNCGFCHLCDALELKRRKKGKIASWKNSRSNSATLEEDANPSETGAKEQLKVSKATDQPAKSDGDGASQEVASKPDDPSGLSPLAAPSVGGLGSDAHASLVAALGPLVAAHWPSGQENGLEPEEDLVQSALSRVSSADMPPPGRPELTRVASVPEDEPLPPLERPDLLRVSSVPAPGDTDMDMEAPPRPALVRRCVSEPAGHVAVEMPAPQTITREVSAESGNEKVFWHVPPLTMQSRDRSALSPPFPVSLPGRDTPVQFKLLLFPKESSQGRGGSSFKKAKGKGYIELKCETDLQGESLALKFRLFVGKESSEDTLTHDFSKQAVVGLPTEKSGTRRMWDLEKSVIENGSLIVGAEFVV